MDSLYYLLTHFPNHLQMGTGIMLTTWRMEAMPPIIEAKGRMKFERI